MPIRGLHHSEQRQRGGSDLLSLREVRGGSNPNIGGWVTGDHHHGPGIACEVRPSIIVCEIVRDPAHLSVRVRNRPQLTALIMVVHYQEEGVSFREPERSSDGAGTGVQFTGATVRDRD